MINDDSSLNLTGPSLAWLYFTYKQPLGVKLKQNQPTDCYEAGNTHGDRLIVYIQSSQHCSKNWLGKHKINKQLQIFVHLVSANFSIKSQNQGKNAPLRRAS